jgi:molybdopterin-guanine dinucleotide biosynthesis protein A
VAGAVLLGGASRRMGRDKATLTLDGVAFATRVARTLATLCEEVWLVGGEPPPDAPGRAVPDPPGPTCALRGLATALAATQAPRVLVLATDLPLVSPPLLLALLARDDADVVLPRSPRGLEPLCAVYRREPALAAARRRLSEGRLSLHGILDVLPCRTIEPEELARLDPDGLALRNLNSPEELAAAEAALAARRRGLSRS